MCGRCVGGGRRGCCTGSCWRWPRPSSRTQVWGKCGGVGVGGGMLEAVKVKFTPNLGDQNVSLAPAPYRLQHTRPGALFDRSQVPAVEHKCRKCTQQFLEAIAERLHGADATAARRPLCPQVYRQGRAAGHPHLAPGRPGVNGVAGVESVGPHWSEKQLHVIVEQVLASAWLAR